MLATRLVSGWNSSLRLYIIWALHILGLYPSWGTSRICPAWSPSEHQLTPALSPFGARVRSQGVRRRLFIALMTAAHISPNVFALRNFLSNIHELFLTVHASSFISFMHHIYMHNYIFYLHVSFTNSLLWIFMAGRLPSVPCVQYTNNLLNNCGMSPFLGSNLPVWSANVGLLPCSEDLLIEMEGWLWE